MLAQAYLGVGDLSRAESFARMGRDVVEEDDSYSQGTTWFALALVLAGQDKQAEALDAFAHALTDLEASGESYEIGDTHLEQAAFLLNHGDPDGAKTHLEQAKEAFTDLETKDKLDRIAALQKQLD